MVAVAKSKMNVGLLGFGVELHKAGEDNKGVELDSLCECGKRPGAPIIVADAGGSPVVATNGGTRIECGCGASYSSWFQLPKRGWPKGASEYDVILTTDEVKAAKAPPKPHESFEVEKVVELQRLLQGYALGDAYFVLPDKKSSEFERKAYATFVAALDHAGWTLLTRHTSRGTTSRYAVVADKARGILMAHKVVDLRELPREHVLPAVTEQDIALARMVLQASYHQDAEFEAEPDGLLLLMEQRLGAQVHVAKVAVGVAE